MDNQDLFARSSQADTFAGALSGDLPVSVLREARQSFSRGEITRAETLCRQVLALRPGNVEALTILGTIDFQAGRLDQAMGWWQRAREVEPGNASHHNNLGATFLRAERLAEAASCFREALRLQPGNASAHNNLSYVFYCLARYSEAQACAERALALRPDFAEAYNHLGLAHLEQGRCAEAENHFRTALRLRPDLVSAILNLGQALQNQGQPAEAERYYRQALVLDPHRAEAYQQLGSVLKEQGNFAAAAPHLRRAIELKPHFALAWWSLSQLGKLAESELGQLRALLENRRSSLLDQSTLHRTLADELDRRQSYDAAFVHYREAGVLRKQDLQQSGDAFDLAGLRTLVDQMIGTFDEAFFRQARPAGSASELPVFVVGMLRSGTTLVEQILSSHSQIVGAGELNDLKQRLTTLHQTSAAGYPACMRSVPESVIRELAEGYLKGLAKGGRSARVIDKMPDNFLHLGAIALLFPHARIIHCRRDPLDTCLSCYFQNFKKVPFASSLEDLGDYYREYERLMAHWRRVLPLRMLEVRYEDLVARQETISRELVAYCGLPWEERCLSFHENPRPVQTSSDVQVRQPIYSTSVGRWRRYAAHLEPLRLALGISGPLASANPPAGLPASVTGGDEPFMPSPMPASYTPGGQQ